MGQTGDAAKEEDATLDKGRSWWPFTRKQAAGEAVGPDAEGTGPEAEPGLAGLEADGASPEAAGPGQSPELGAVPEPPLGESAEPGAVAATVPEASVVAEPEKPVKSAKAPKLEPALTPSEPEAQAESSPPAAEPAPVEASSAAEAEVSIPEAARPPQAAAAEGDGNGVTGSAPAAMAGHVVQSVSGETTVPETPVATSAGPLAPASAAEAETTAAPEQQEAAEEAQQLDGTTEGSPAAAAEAPSEEEPAAPAQAPEAAQAEPVAEAVESGVTAAAPGVPEPEEGFGAPAEQASGPVAESGAAGLPPEPAQAARPGADAEAGPADEAGQEAAPTEGLEPAAEESDEPAVAEQPEPVALTLGEPEPEAAAAPEPEDPAYEIDQIASAMEPGFLAETPVQPAAEPVSTEPEEDQLMAQDEQAVELRLYTGQDAADDVPSVFSRSNLDDTHLPAPVPKELLAPTAHEDRYQAFADEEDDYVPAALRASNKARESSDSKYYVGDDLQAPAYNTNQEDSRPLKDVHLDDILREAVERRASDIHITTGLPPMVRVDGEVVPLSYEITTPDQSQRLLYEVLSDDNLEKFEQKHELDFGYTVKGLARFRVNVYMQRGSVAAALRMIPNRIPSYDELRLPATIRDIAKRSSGLILVTGPTGSGKSTTIASMIDDINETRQGHILTIEDPIEYLHRHKRCMVNQREMHGDTYSFHNALRAVLREDPDIILVGELRDLETIEAALTLAETGHLVFGTLHTRNAPSTIDRVVDVFPADQQDQIRVLLANTIEGIVSQQLLPKLGGGRVAAFEIMTGIAAVKNLIREGKTHQMYSVIETSKNVGMVTMDSSLAELFRGGYVSYDECLLRAVDKDSFARLAKNAA